MATESNVNSCVSCDSRLPPEAVFCSNCGSYQGQPGIDHGTSAATVRAVDTAFRPRALAQGLRLCPHCGAAVSDIASACTNCFRPLEHTTVASGPELKPASHGLVWFIVAISVVLTAIFFASEAVNVVHSIQHPGIGTSRNTSMIAVILLR